MTQPDSTSPEHLTPHSGLYFELVQPELIEKAIYEGQSGVIAKALLMNPAESVMLEVKSDGSSFDVESEVRMAFDLSGRRTKRYIDSFVDKLKRGGIEVIERGGRYLFKGQNGTDLVIGEGDILLGWTNITTGDVKEPYDNTTRVFPSPKISKDTVQNTLSDVIAATGALVDTIYQINGKSTPDQGVKITPPKRRVDRLGKTALNESGPSELMSKIEIDRPNVTFDEIGGQETAKREVEGLAFALSNPDLYKKWGTRPPKGVLLYGPPGTGKTLMAKALASQAKARFLHVKASDIGSKWYGESEQIVEQIFQFAGENGKTIIYFDEIDSIAPPRDGKHEATQKVIGTLLQNIDGIGSSDNVMIVASTNKLQNIDEAMLRPGRLDRLVDVGLPDEQGIKQIFGIHQQKVNKVADRELFDGVDTEHIAEMMKGFSGADIAEIIRRTLEEKVRQEGIGKEPGLVTTGDIVGEIKAYERVKEERSKRSGQYL